MSHFGDHIYCQNIILYISGIPGVYIKIKFNYT